MSYDGMQNFSMQSLGRATARGRDFRAISKRAPQPGSPSAVAVDAALKFEIMIKIYAIVLS